MKLKQLFPEDFSCPPEGAAVLGAILGVVVLQCPWIAFLILFLWWFCRDKKWIFAGFAVLTALSAFLQPLPDIHGAPKTEKWVRGIFEVTDPGLCRQTDVPLPALVKAYLREAYSADGKRLPYSGRILVRVPRDYEGRMFSGDLLAGEGLLAEPHGSFSRYTAVQRVKWIFSPEDCKPAGPPSGSFLRMISEVREKLLVRAVSHFSSPERRMASAALFFGIRGGLGGTERQKLVHAGVIHLYSVSGLHVGIFAGVLLFFLRGIPCRWKYGILIPVTLLYVVSTGANVPAVRAWVMISVWAACRVFLHWMPVRRVLGYTAAVMLIWQPSWLYDMGFLYSFEITLVLLLLGQNLQNLRKHLSDPVWLMPRNTLRARTYRILRMRNTVICAFFSCAAAFLGGAVTGMMFQGQFLPGSVIANFLLLPVIGILFPVMVLKLAAGWLWSGLDKALAWGIERLWDLMDVVIALVQYADATVIGIPPLWSSLLFLGCFITALSPGFARKIRIAGAVICTGVLIFWHCLMIFRSPEVMIVYGGFASVPAVAVADTRAGVGVVVNVPDSAAAVKMADFFVERGIASVDRVLVSSPRSGNIRGLQTLDMRVKIRQLVLPELDRYSRGYRAQLVKIRKDIADLGVTDNSGNVQLKTGPEGWYADYDNPASGTTCFVHFASDPETLTVNGRTVPFIRSSESTAMVFRL